MTPQILITQNGGVEIVVSYDPVQTAFGDIQGNVGAVDNAIVRTNGASGGVIQGSSASLDDSGNMGLPGNLDIGGNLTVTGIILTTGNVGVVGDLTVTGDLTATNASLQVASVQSAGVVTASGFALSPGYPPYVALTSNANGDANEVSCYVKADGTTFTAGQAVYISSVNGQNKIVSKAQANNEFSSSRTLGLLKQNLAANAFGYVVTQGLLTGLDITVASTVSEGDPVWLSPTVAGGLVFGEANKPSSPNHLVYLGVVVKKNGSTKVNQIEVKIQNSNELAELSDVQITGTPANNSQLFWNSSIGCWVNRIATQSVYVPSTAVSVNSGAITTIGDFKNLITFAGGDTAGFVVPVSDALYNVSEYLITLHLLSDTTNAGLTDTFNLRWVKSQGSSFTPSVGDPSVSTSITGYSSSLFNVTFAAITATGQAVKFPKFRVLRNTPASAANLYIVGITLTY